MKTISQWHIEISSAYRRWMETNRARDLADYSEDLLSTIIKGQERAE